MLPGLAGPGQSGPQLGRNGPLTSLPGSEFNLGQRPEGQVCKLVLSSCCRLVVHRSFWYGSYSNFNRK